jgi:hypothetical protein
MKGVLLHEELSKSIVGAAMTVLNTLKPGLDENIASLRLALLLNFKYADLRWKRLVG